MLLKYDGGFHTNSKSDKAFNKALEIYAERLNQKKETGIFKGDCYMDKVNSVLEIANRLSSGGVNVLTPNTDSGSKSIIEISQKLKDIQEATVADIERVLDRYGVVNVERPTGFGKTHIILNWITDKGLRCLYLYDRNSNKERVINTYGLEEECVRSYSKFFRDSSEVFTSYVVDNNIDVVVFDESHTVGAKTIDTKWSDCIEFCLRNNVKVIGCTATELRMSGINVTETYFHNRTVFKYDIADAVDDGIIKLPLYITTAISNEEAGKIEEYISENERRVIKEANNLSDLLLYSFDECGIRNNNYHKIIVFCSTIREIIDIRQSQYEDLCNNMFPDWEVNVIPVTSDSEHVDNVKQIDEYSYRDKAVDIFLAVDMMDQGFHFDDLSGIILVTSTNSGRIFTQRVGRCMSVMNHNNMFVLDLDGNLDVDFNYANKVAKLFYDELHEDNRQGHDWRDEERTRVRMSPKQREAGEIISKVRTQKQVADAKNLSALVKFYRRFPEKNVLLAGEAAGLSPYATMEYLDNLDILRTEDKLTDKDYNLGITKAFRLVSKYKKVHNIS